MKNLNLPPFYAGQKVVCVNPTDRLIKDKIYTVISCFIDCCGYWAVTLSGIPDISESDLPILKGEICRCYKNDHIRISSGLRIFYASRFTPVQEQRLPLITLSKIQETEKEEILINN